MDIPLPGGLKYMPDESAVIESETVRAARLMYSSSFEPGSLVLSIQEGLLGNGWRLTRTTAFPNVGTIQLYEKGESSLQVRIWEGGAFSSSTYVELSGTRALPQPAEDGRDPVAPHSGSPRPRSRPSRRRPSGVRAA